MKLSSVYSAYGTKCAFCHQLWWKTFGKYWIEDQSCLDHMQYVLPHKYKIKVAFFFNAQKYDPSRS